MNSLQARLHVGLGLTLALIMVLLGWLAISALSHVAEQLVSSRLEHDGEALLASLQQDEQGAWQLKSSQVGHIYQRVFSGHYYVIEVAGQRLRSRSLWDAELPLTTLSRGEQQLAQLRGPDKQLLLVWQAGFTIGQYSVQILVAEDITPLHQSLEKLTLVLAISSFVALIVLLVVQRWVVLRTLRPLHKVTRELESLSSGELTELSASVPDEIKPLVDEVNRLLQLIAQRLQRSRNAMGNLAHSLKHPLNLLLQLAQHPELDEQVKGELQRNASQIHQLMERELKRARLAGAAMPGQHFSANEELPTLIDVLQRVYQQQQLIIDYDIPRECRFHADRNDMLELFGNLLDNACKWAQGQVMCRIRCETEVDIVIEDDGPGVADDGLENLTQRGVRIDESVAGSGLGLAIVKEIVSLYGGEMSFSRSSLGGLRVRVVLPLTSQKL